MAPFFVQYLLCAGQVRHKSRICSQILAICTQTLSGKCMRLIQVYIVQIVVIRLQLDMSVEAQHGYTRYPLHDWMMPGLFSGPTPSYSSLKGGTDTYSSGGTSCPGTGHLVLGPCTCVGGTASPIRLLWLFLLRKAFECFLGNTQEKSEHHKMPIAVDQELTWQYPLSESRTRNVDSVLYWWHCAHTIRDLYRPVQTSQVPSQ